MAKSLVVIAPLLGLLGTVAGMIETFDSLAEMALFRQSGGIAGGISKALFTTQLGLAVAIPGYFLLAVLQRRQKHLESELLKLQDLLHESLNQTFKPSHAQTKTNP
jgi:biopolymer transport protein ExbB